MTKFCKGCKEEKDLSCFSKKTSYCKPCKAEKYRKPRYCSECRGEIEYTPNKKGSVSACKSCKSEYDKKRKAKLKEEYYQYLSKIGCLCCEEAHPFALEVHHLDSDYKRYGRSQGSVANRQDLENGLAVVLCASCHNIFHGHFGGKNQPFPTQTKESVREIVDYSRRVFT